MRILIGEDDTLLREGLVSVLERDGGFEVAALAATGDEVVGLSAEVLPDLVLTDIRMPPGFTDEGLRAALRIRIAQPSMPIVVLSQYVQRRYATELLTHPTAGTGYLLKQRVGDVAVFCADVRRVRDGQTVLDPEVVDLLIARAGIAASPSETFTGRQHDVLALLAAGRSNAFIAHALHISEKAVVHHVSHIYDRLGLALNDDDHRRVLAVVRYLTRLGDPTRERPVRVGRGTSA